ncbi:MAG: hypothetical protein K2P95_09405 [Hyphomonadaceae bacterium]|nr:hypothetical protein [Hyphomonadaceae bacterium]
MAALSVSSMQDVMLLKLAPGTLHISRAMRLTLLCSASISPESDHTVGCTVIRASCAKAAPERVDATIIAAMAAPPIAFIA